MVPVLGEFLVTECGDGSKVSLCTWRFSVCSHSSVSGAFCSYFLFFGKLRELVSQQRESVCPSESIYCGTMLCPLFIQQIYHSFILQLCIQS